MKRIITISILSTLALVLTACGASAGSAQSNSSSGASVANTASLSPVNSAPANGTPATGLSALQLAAGMLKLDGTSNAVTAQEAAQLLPLWQSLQQTESAPIAPGGPQDNGTPGARPNSAMMQQVSAQIVSIENGMPPAQIQAITAMNLSRQDIFTTFQQAGITMGGFGPGGSGFRMNGGTFTPGGTFAPPQGTPRAPGIPGAFQGNFNGGRQGFGNFIPEGVVNGMVQFLQKKAGS